MSNVTSMRFYKIRKKLQSLRKKIPFSNDVLLLMLLFFLVSLPAVFLPALKPVADLIITIFVIGYTITIVSDVLRRPRY